MNIFSFFSGAGFLDLGFELSGHYDVVYVNEFHKAFNDVYRYARAKMGISAPKYGHHVENINNLFTDEGQHELQSLCHQIEESKAKDITGIIGGPPCPDFSVAGKNRGRYGDNGKLSGTYTEIVCRTLPDFFLFENVKGLYRTGRHREFFEELKIKFVEAGYYLTEQLVNALEFGAPQDRERIILLGFHRSLVDKLNLPIDDDTHTVTDFCWEEHKLFTREQVFSADWPKTNPFVEDVQTAQPNNIIPELTIQHWWRKNEVEKHPNSGMYFQPRAGLKRFQEIPEGDDCRKSYKRLHRWRYSPTAAYGNNEVHIHPYHARRISVSEALAIQSLPANFELPKDMTLTDAFKTIGNGVPYVLALGVAKSIHSYLSLHHGNN